MAHAYAITAKDCRMVTFTSEVCRKKTPRDRKLGRVQDRHVALSTNGRVEKSRYLPRYAQKACCTRCGIENGCRVLDGIRAKRAAGRWPARF